MEFHPIANEYPMMPAAALNDLADDMRLRGFDSRFPIVLFQGLILDGRNRFLASDRAEVKPHFVEFKGSDEDATLFVQRANEHRRHLTPEWVAAKREERVERVKKARSEGRSNRAIAEAEGVDEKTVRNDLQESGADQSAPENESGKITGKDGKSYRAKGHSRKKAAEPPVLCRHCEHREKVGKPIIENCPDCKHLRDLGVKARKAPKAEPTEWQDDEGNVAPQRLVPVFKAVALYRLAEKQMNALAKTWKDIEACPARVAKPLDPSKQHFEKFASVFKNARWRQRMMRPAMICGGCEGDGCKKCADKGWLTVEEVEAGK